MKRYDFTFPGGMDIDQEWLDWWQSSWRELAEGIAAASGHLTGPYAVGGALTSFPAPDEAHLSKGLFFYEGELYVVTGDLGIAGMAGGDEAYVIITDASVAIPYNDGTTHAARLDQTISLEARAIGTADTPTMFRLASLKPYGREKDWTQIVVAGVMPGDISGNIYYKKDFVTNTLLIRGSLHVDDAGPLPILPNPAYATLGSVPPGYIPISQGTFAAEVFQPGGVLPIPTDPGGNYYIRFINCLVDTDGTLQFQFVNGVTGGATDKYDIRFNTRISLD